MEIQEYLCSSVTSKISMYKCGNIGMLSSYNKNKNFKPLRKMFWGPVVGLFTLRLLGISLNIMYMEATIQEHHVNFA